MSTPHARGSTHAMIFLARGHPVYPACAGIHLGNATDSKIVQSLPGMRGDPPVEEYFALAGYESTPHARGSTPESLADTPHTPVYPACAGIHPSNIAR